jgi:hypothetical protein
MWKINDRVLAYSNESNYLYPGTIRHQDGKRFYVILDNREDGWYGASQLEAFELAVGDRIQARRNPGSEYLPATVAGIEGERIRVQFSDGADWVSTAHIRIDPVARRVSSSLPSEHLQLGTRIFGRWKGDLYWYPATVLRHTPEGYQVLFDDQDQDILKENEIRPLQLVEGDEVGCRPKNESRPIYYPATILAVHDNELVDVRFGPELDTVETNMPIGRLRIRLSAPTISNFQEGDRVLAPFEDGYIYPGVVLSVDSDRTLIHFLDGTQGWVPTEQLRALEFEPGQRVEARWQAGQAYFPGSVSECQGDKLHIHYDDGDREWTLVRLVRLPREGDPVTPDSDSERGLA